MDFLTRLRNYRPRDAVEVEVKMACLRLIETQREAAFGRGIAGEIGHLTSAAFITNPSDTKILLVYGSKLGCWKLPGEHVESEGEVWEVAQRQAGRALAGATIVANRELFALTQQEIPEYWNTPAHRHFEVVWRFRAEASTELPPGAQWFSLEQTAPSDYAMLARVLESANQRP